MHEAPVAQHLANESRSIRQETLGSSGPAPRAIGTFPESAVSPCRRPGHSSSVPAWSGMHQDSAFPLRPRWIATPDIGAQPAGARPIGSCPPLEKPACFDTAADSHLVAQEFP